MSLWSLLRAPKDGVLGMNRRNLELVLPRNPRWAFPIADDKLQAKEVLGHAGVALAPTVDVFRSFGEIAEVERRLAPLDEFAIKPANGSGGRGILVVAGRTAQGCVTPGGRVVTPEGLRRHIGDIVFGVYNFDRPDAAFVEPRLRPAPFFARLFPDGISDVRVIVADERLALTMIRVPTKRSDGKANLHQGAVGLGVELASGTVTRAWHLGRSIQKHPDTGALLLGMEVPDWPALIDIAMAVARAVPLKYIGVDIVVDAVRGPLVLEFNVRPGLEIQNVTGVPLRRRLQGLEVLR